MFTDIVFEERENGFWVCVAVIADSFVRGWGIVCVVAML